MLKTTGILKKINGISNNLLPIQFKNSETGEMFGFDGCFIEEEVLLLLASSDGQATISNYSSFLANESWDDCWNSHVEYDVEDDEEPFTEDDLFEAKYEIITGLETLVYFEDSDEAYEMKSAEVTEDALVLTF